MRWSPEDLLDQFINLLNLNKQAYQWEAERREHMFKGQSLNQLTGKLKFKDTNLIG